MDTRLYLTVAAIVAILYALAFLLFPVHASLFFSGFAEPRAISYLRFCGAAILAWGLIIWFARDFPCWYPVRSVLIASVGELVVNRILNVWAIVTGYSMRMHGGRRSSYCCYCLARHISSSLAGCKDRPGFELARERIEGLLLGADQQGDHFSVAQKIRDQLDQAFDGHRGGAAQFLRDIIEWLDEHYLGR